MGKRKRRPNGAIMPALEFSQVCVGQVVRSHHKEGEEGGGGPAGPEERVQVKTGWRGRGVFSDQLYPFLAYLSREKT